MQNPADCAPFDSFDRLERREKFEKVLSNQETFLLAFQKFIIIRPEGKQLSRVALEREIKYLRG
jgi:hypothetical protein